MAQKVIGSCSAGKKAKAEALFAFMATLVLDANISKAFQHWISTSGCQILSNGCCTAVLSHLKCVDLRQLWFSQAVWGC